MNIILWPLVLFFFAVLALALVMIGVSQLLGQRHSERTTGDPYESGIIPTGSALTRFDANFYLIAVFFVIFDLETLFILSWAIAIRELGWGGYIEILVFIAILFIALIYLWGTGGLDLGMKKVVWGRDSDSHQ